jgi:hypothetical protein
MRIIKVLVLLITFSIGGLIGFVVKNWPFIKWNHEVKIYEVAWVLCTLFIGLVLPFFIKKWIEDSRGVKSSLIDECKDTLSEVSKISNRLEKVYYDGEVLPEDKDKINSMFSYNDLKVGNLIDNIRLVYSNRLPACADIKTTYIDFWKMITGGDLMISSYNKIDDRLYRTQAQQFIEFEHAVRRTIIEIHKM